MTQPFVDVEADTIRLFDQLTIALTTDEPVIYIRDWPGSIRRQGAYGNTQN